MRRRLSLILALVIAMMTAKVVCSDRSYDTQSHSLRAEQSSVAIQSLSHRPLLRPDLRNSTKHAGFKGSGPAIVLAKLGSFDPSVARIVPVGERPYRSTLARPSKHARAPPYSS